MAAFRCGPTTMLDLGFHHPTGGEAERDSLAAHRQSTSGGRVGVQGVSMIDNNRLTMPPRQPPAPVTACQAL